MFSNIKKKTPVIEQEPLKESKPKKVKVTVKEIKSDEVKPEEKPKTKTTKINETILSLISDDSKKYTLQQFDKLIGDIHTGINEGKDQNYIKKYISKYAKVVNGKIQFDISSENTEMTYKTLKYELEKSKDYSHHKNPAEDVFMFGKKKQQEVEEEDDNDEVEDDLPVWQYPVQPPIQYKQKSGPQYEPYPTTYQYGGNNNQPIHDVLDKDCKKRTKQFEYLATLPYEDQGTPGWFAAREKVASASDGGCIVGVNSHEAPWKFLAKKVMKPPFQSNMFCHHGKKYEQIATMIYEFRANVIVKEFGLVNHPKYYFLGASPDGIVSHYKLDGVSLTNAVGTMLEIKCPLVRNINLDGDIKGEICPIYYWVQVQLQLECCDLDKCDFWQVSLIEYTDREDFIRDTDLDEPYLSRTSGFEKGCVIQLLPKSRVEEVNNGEYLKVLYESSKYIYPPKIDMSPYEYDMWIAETMANFNKVCPQGYYFDKIVYWKLIKSKCVTIERDKEWFAEYLPIIEEMWHQVEYLREHKEKAEILFDYIEYLPTKNNKKIMELVKIICNEPSESDEKGIKNYSQKIHWMQQETLKNKKAKEEIEAIDRSDEEQ
jgi:putative phage-type endonuclease